LFEHSPDFRRDLSDLEREEREKRSRLRLLGDPRMESSACSPVAAADEGALEAGEGVLTPKCGGCHQRMQVEGDKRSNSITYQLI